MKFFRCFLLLYTVVAYNQTTGKSEIMSLQGSSMKLENRLYISQTIGQLSLIDIFTKNEKTNSKSLKQSQYKFHDYINEQNPNNVICFPNPFIDTIHIKFPKIVQDEVIVFVFDQQGKLVQQLQTKAENNSIKLSLYNLQPAIYNIVIYTKNNKYYTKIIKI